MKVTISEQELNNLLAFLDRVEYKGVKEVNAVSQIILALNQAEEDVEK